MAAGLALGPAAGAAAAPPAAVIVLPGATSAEGIAVGPGAVFYAGDLFRGDIYRGDLQRGTAARFIAAPAGRMAVGMKVDVASGLLFVAGGFTGQAYVYDTATGATRATYQLGDPAGDPRQRRGGHPRRGLVHRQRPPPSCTSSRSAPGGAWARCGRWS